MAIRDIIYLPNLILRRKAHKVVHFDRDLQRLIDDMIQTLRYEPGVGLAAPQVGVSQRVIVVEYGQDDDDEEEGAKQLFIVINPEIIQASAEKVTGIEGCLSVPNLIGEVERHQSIIVKGQDRRGKPFKGTFDGWIARIFQHEIDHLDGILFPDRATRVWQPKEDEKELVD